MQNAISRIGHVLGCAILVACQGAVPDPPARSAVMSRPTPVENKQLVRRLFEDGFNRRNLTAIDELVAAEYVDATGERGPAAFKQVIERLGSAFPDIRYDIDDVLAEDDRVAIRWHWSGTHRGSFRGVAPTERSLTNAGTAIFRLRDGKIVAASLETDRLGFLQSIGVVPPNEVLFAKPRQ
jgi:steroid delta-isomerase-like uncharacterized protein